MDSTRSMPRVSVVIVNWNRAEEVERCLRRLGQIKEPAFEVVIVDNGSTDGSLDRLRAMEDEGVRVVDLPTNLGPSEGRNAAMDVIRGDYAFFLDSDALPGRLTLARLVGRLEADPHVAVIGCQIVDGRTRRVDQWIHAGDPEARGRLEFDTYSFSAAGAIVRADVLREVGGFWSLLFIYNEEVDLSIRILRTGRRIVYLPAARVFHFPSRRGRMRPKEYWYYQIRNWIWIFYRYYPAPARLRKVVLYAGLYLIKSAAARQFPACVRGIVAGLRRVEIIGAYGDKLDRADILRLEALNRRVASDVRWGR